MFSQIFTDKTWLIIVTIVGMAICARGIGQVSARGEWSHPLSILGYGLGALALVVVGAALVNINLPLIDSPRAAWIAVVAIAIAKIALTQAHRAIA